MVGVLTLMEKMEDGEICTICHLYFAEDYGYPIACENCGGDGVLADISASAEPTPPTN